MLFQQLSRLQEIAQALIIFCMSKWRQTTCLLERVICWLMQI
jgi:hypothetical protein